MNAQNNLDGKLAAIRSFQKSSSAVLIFSMSSSGIGYPLDKPPKKKASKKKYPLYGNEYQQMMGRIKRGTK